MPSQDIWKFTPVSYRTSALWGRCPALTPLLQLSLQAGHRVLLTMCNPWMTCFPHFTFPLVFPLSYLCPFTPFPFSPSFLIPPLLHHSSFPPFALFLLFFTTFLLSFLRSSFTSSFPSLFSSLFLLFSFPSPPSNLKSPSNVLSFSRLRDASCHLIGSLLVFKLCHWTWWNGTRL